MTEMTARVTERPRQLGSYREAPSGVAIGDVRHPVAQRISDVLRAAAGRRRTFLIDDEENILQAVRRGVRVDSLYATVGRESACAPLLAALPEAVPSHVLADDVAKALFGPGKRSRVFALAERPVLPELAALTKHPGDIVVLDGVRLAGNIGAVTRTACAFDAAGVVLIDSGLTAVVDRRLVRASRGTVFAVPVVLATGRQLREYLQQQDIPLVSLSSHASAPLSAVSRINERIALLLGSERSGASETMERGAAYRYAVPMSPDVESLNVSVAAAIALYERRSRTLGNDVRPRPTM